MVLNFGSGGLFGKGSAEGIGASTSEKRIIQEMNKRTIRRANPNDFTHTLTDRTDDGLHFIRFAPGVSNRIKGVNFHIPESWEGKQLEITLHWYAQDGNVGDVLWRVDLWPSIPGQGYTQVTAHFEVAATEGQRVLVLSKKTTRGLDLKQDGVIGIYVERRGNQGADNYTGTVDFLMLSLREEGTG